MTDSSKYGIYLNDSKDKITSPIQLQDGDTIRFGFQQQQWRISYEPFVVATSRLNDAAEKDSMISSIKKLGGHYVNNWIEECTHLVVNEIRVTVKVLSALTSCKPIVTPKYIIDLVNSIESRKEWIDPEIYLPTLSEIEGDVTSRDQFKVNTKRQNIFSSKTFVFLINKQYQRLKQAVTSCGASTRLVESRDSIDQTLLLSTDSLVITPNLHAMKALTPAQKDLIETVEGLLLTNGFRLISDSEIGLAVIHTDAQKYCNPSDPSIVSAPQPKHPIDPATSSRRTTTSDIESSQQDTKQKRPLQITDSEQLEPQKKAIKLEYDTHNTESNVVNKEDKSMASKADGESRELTKKEENLTGLNDNDKNSQQENIRNGCKQCDPPTSPPATEIVVKPGYLSTKLYADQQINTEDCEREFNRAKEKVIHLTVVRTESKHHVDALNDIKNFKKFRKSYYPGRDRVGLPTIIGGNDLLRYTAGSDSSLGDWIHEARRAHDEKAQEDQLADDLFSNQIEEKRVIISSYKSSHYKSKN
ncbi:uncharacterized protein TRIADDRAFT_55562 [Trichoplax adhaerens]|uniref:BRCT domain-containing protein n=1 Tax=Trichoplax adhaerens TaxID=10228 RepID=B3RV84_TRIAD|nr:hypothetical protein TRIADDRAFT_55562 [Trichoplax adhaerens]EDV25459.1 hypothetical protein TRIADDRAFT_55562 [Trichoplax adhaerens]|eukprot:XP_002111492.1 hypothetical protein TRIADDRAFT_55562 [Trichoplax adhaerens]